MSAGKPPDRLASDVAGCLIWQVSDLTHGCEIHQDLVDSEIFLQARGVLEGLARHNCSAALAWCEENCARLKRLKSKLEFKLRVQVYP